MKQNGFSLIELMVVIGILTLINISIFVQYPEFSQRVALKRTSEEIALIVRQAQAYALGIKRSASGADYSGFGINFKTSDPKSLILFTDSVQGTDQPNKQYDAGDGCGKPPTECFQEFKIDTGDYISELQVCDLDDDCDSVDALDVVYPRAASIATISSDSSMESVSYAKVTIKSPRGDEGKNKKLIKIWRSGQILVEDFAS